MNRLPLVDGDLRHIDPSDETVTVQTRVILKEGDQVTVEDADGATCKGEVEEVVYIVRLDLETKRAGRS